MSSIRSRASLAFASMAILASPSRPAAAAQELFEPREFFAATTVYGSTIADIDLDGDLDVIVATASGFSVVEAVNGGFAPAVEHSIGGPIGDVAAADADGDGDLDVFAARTWSSVVDVVQNLGNGTFAVSGTLATPGVTPQSITSTDLDADGRPDLLLAFPGLDRLGVLRSTGPSTFAPLATIVLPGGVASLEVAELNGDAWPDLAVALQGGGGLLVLLGSGGGQFTAPVTYALWGEGTALEACDLDGDADRDLVVASWTSVGELHAFVNDGTGQLTATAVTPLGPFRVSVLSSGDPDLDLDLELLAVGGDPNDGSSGRMLVLENLAGAFQTASTTVPNGGIELECVDVDRDGLPDALLSGSVVTVHHGRGDGTFDGGGAPTYLGVQAPKEVIACEMTGDGTLDLVIVTTQDLRIARGRGDGTFDPPAVAYGPIHIADGLVTAGDLDGDGDTDLLLHSGAPGWVRLDNDGTGVLGASPFVVGGRHRLADIDGDGDPDLVTGVAGALEIRFNQGGTLGAPTLVPVPGAPGGCLVLDVADHDGDLDLDLAYAGTVRLATLVNLGGGTFAPGAIGPSIPAFQPVRSMVSGDLDGDGDGDVAYVDVDYVRVLANDGAGTLAPTWSLYDPGFPYDVAVADLEFDGVPEVVTACFAGWPAIYFRQGNSYSGPLYVAGTSGSAFVIDDLEGDGDLDLATVSETYRWLTVLLGTRTDRPNPFCEAKANSLGCTPAIDSDGVPSASSGAPFWIRAANVLNRRRGILFYGLRAQASPFQGGTLCLAAPLRRAWTQMAGGSPFPANDCTGTYAFDFNAWIRSGVDPTLVPGAQVLAQAWTRDPFSARGTGLTDGLRFRIRP